MGVKGTAGINEKIFCTLGGDAQPVQRRCSWRPSILLAVFLALSIAVSVGCFSNGDEPAQVGKYADSQVERKPYFLKGAPKKSPQRIVSVSPNVTEIIYALGAGDRLVGVTRFCDYPAPAKALPKIGGFWDLSLEAVVGLHPDLVICVPNAQNQTVTSRLSDMGLSIYMTYGYDLQDVKTSISAIGDVLEVPQRARELNAQLTAELDLVRQQVRGLAKPKVLFLYGRRPLVAAGPGSYANALIEIAGGVNVAAVGNIRYPTLSVETVIGYAPDVIIDAYQAGHGAAEELDLKRIQVIPAVKNNRVYPLSHNAALRPGPRAPQDARLLAERFHGLQGQSRLGLK